MFKISCALDQIAKKIHMLTKYFVITVFITKRDKKNITKLTGATKWDRIYYKVLQVSQSVTMLKSISQKKIYTNDLV